MLTTCSCHDPTHSPTEVDRPTIVLRALQKLMSFLKARKSKSSCRDRGTDAEAHHESAEGLLGHR